MDLNLIVPNSISEARTVVQEALMQQKTFLNVDGMQHNLLFSIILLLLKSVVAGYGSKKVVPEIVTVLFMCMSVCIICFINESWSSVVGQIMHSLAVIAIQSQAESFIPHIVIWYAYSLYCKFFLDCYVVVTLFSYIWRKYSTRPHALGTLICCLCIGHYLMDQLVSVTSRVSQSLIFYYVPGILLESIGAEQGLNILPHMYMILWAVSKLPSINWSKPAQTFTCSYLNDINLNDLLDEFGRRKAFLNVDKNDYCAVFYFLQILKSFMSVYAMKNVIGLLGTAIMTIANWFLCLLNRNMKMVLLGLVYFIMSTPYVFYLDWKQYPLNSRSMLWLILCFDDDHLHFFLDSFLLISTVIYIKKAYDRDLLKILQLISFLFFIEQSSNAFIGEKLCWKVTVATLYFPVMIISTFSALNSETRHLCTALFISLWLAFKHIPVPFDYYVSKYFYNFYETMEAFIRDLNDELNIRRLRRDAMIERGL